MGELISGVFTHFCKRFWPCFGGDLRRIDSFSHQICVFSWMHPHFPIVGDFVIFWSGFGTVQVGPVVRVDYNIPETFLHRE